MRVSLNSYNPEFEAHLMSRWRCKTSADGGSKNLTVVALERRDSPFINKFIDVADKDTHLPNIKQIILDSALKTAKTFFESKFEGFNKVKVLMGICDSKPCGLLVANIPKLSENGEVCCTSRHNSSKNEGELDWLVTWGTKDIGGIRGVGKALVGEFFKTLKGDRIRDVYVKSELPENSYAQFFYESLGFEFLGEKREKLERRTSKPYLVDSYCDPNDMIVPMIITRKNIRGTLDFLQKSMPREDLKGKSVDIEKLVSM